MLDYDETRAPIRPESLLPFRVEQSRIREGLRHWFGSRWFALARLKRQAMIDTVRGLYIPYWTFDACVRCPRSLWKIFLLILAAAVVAGLLIVILR